MINNIATLFYAEKLTRHDWKLLKAIAMPAGTYWLFPFGYSGLPEKKLDALCCSLNILKNQGLISGSHLVGDVQSLRFCYGYCCTERGHDAVRLLADPERKQVFPFWGIAAKTSELTTLPF